MDRSARKSHFVIGPKVSEILFQPNEHGPHTPVPAQLIWAVSAHERVIRRGTRQSVHPYSPGAREVRTSLVYALSVTLQSLVRIIGSSHDHLNFFLCSFRSTLLIIRLLVFLEMRSAMLVR